MSTKLAKMMIDAHVRSGLTERQIGAKHGFSQQAFSTWKTGVVPRPSMHSRIAEFLNISTDDVAELSRAGSNQDQLDAMSAVCGPLLAPIILRELSSMGWTIVRSAKI